MDNPLGHDNIDFYFADVMPDGRRVLYRLGRRNDMLTLYRDDNSLPELVESDSCSLPRVLTPIQDADPDLYSEHPEVFQDKVLEVLECCVRAPENLVSKTHIRNAVWPGAAVSGDLEHYLGRLRTLLHDHPDRARRWRLIRRGGKSLVYFGAKVWRLAPPLSTPPMIPPIVPAMSAARDGGTSAEPAPLPLTTLENLQRRAPIRAEEPLRLLDPRFCNIPFIGRVDDSERLWEWLNGEGKVSFQVLAGPGGRGKTRLAIHLLELLELRCRGTWHAGFLDAECRKDVLNHKNFRNWRGSQPTLIIIDDASASAKELADDVVGPVSQPLPDAQLLRFLLIDRGVDDGFEWYQKLVDAAEYHAKYMFMPPLRLRALTSLSELEFGERYQLLDAALDSLHQFDGRPRLRIDDKAKQRLRSDDMGDPLVLFMPAMVAHERQDFSPLTYRRIELADELVRHERQRITALAEPRFLPLHMAAYITLSRGLTPEELPAACEDEKKAVEPDSAWTLIPLNTLLAEKLMPSGNPALAVVPIVPDVVGEVFVEEVLKAAGHAPVETMLRAFLRRPEAVQQTLVNMLQDLAPDMEVLEDATPRQQRLIDWITQLMQMLFDDVEKLRKAGQTAESLLRMPKLVRLAGELAQAKPRIFVPYAAHMCGAWGTMLTAEQRHEQAATYFAAGLRHIKPLAMSSPELHWSLAVSLTGDYCKACQSVGELPDIRLTAPFVAQVPVDGDEAAYWTVFREFIRQMPLERLPKLASDMERLASEWGDKRDLFKRVAQEAIARHAAFERGDRIPVLQEHALFLESQAQLWRAAGHAREALKCASQVIPQLRLLAAEGGDAFLPRLASALSLQADAESERLNWQETLNAITEAVRLYRSVAGHSEGFRPELSLNLLKLAILQSHAEKRQALASLEDAVPYYIENDRLGEESLTLALSTWGSLYNMIALLQWEMGDEDAALETLATKCRIWARPNNIAVKIDKANVPLPAAVAAAYYLPNSTHSYLALVYDQDVFASSWRYAVAFRIEAEYARRMSGDLKGALVFLDHAIADCRRFVERDRKRFLQFLAEWVARQSEWLEESGDWSGALSIIDEAKAAFQDLVQASPGQFSTRLEDLEMCRQLIVVKMAPPSQHSLEAVHAAVHRCRALVTESLLQFRPRLAQALQIQADLQIRNEQKEKALESVIEAIQHNTEMLPIESARVIPILGGLLRSQMSLLSGEEDVSRRILVLMHEQVRRFRELAAKDRNRFLGCLADSLLCQVLALDHCDGHEGVLSVIGEAIAVYDELSMTADLFRPNLVFCEGFGETP